MARNLNVKGTLSFGWGESKLRAFPAIKGRGENCGKSIRIKHNEGGVIIMLDFVMRGKGVVK